MKLIQLDKMALRQPKGMDECVYFTNRAIGKGKAKAWAFKELCEKCGKGLMSKPKDDKTGKVKIRAEEHACPECNHTVDKEEYESGLMLNIEYTCPFCEHKDEIQIPMKRKKVQRFNEEKQKKESVDSFRFACGKCGKNIDITKKIK